MAHGALERRGKGAGVFADLAVHDDGFFNRVHKLDRVLDRDDVFAEVLVDVVDHRRERGRLAAAGRAGDDDEALVEVAQFLQRLGQVELIKGENLGGNLPEYARLSPVVVEEVAAETGDAGNFVREIEVLGFEKLLPAVLGRK